MKKGDIVKVKGGKLAGEIFEVNKIDGDIVFVVRRKEDLDKMAMPMMGDFHKDWLKPISITLEGKEE